MRPTLSIPFLCLAALSLGGCVTAGDRLAAGGPTPLPAPQADAKWEMPWQLAVASPASEAQGERTYVSMVENYGPVRGTEPALRYLNYPLSSIPARKGPNRAVGPCRDVVEKTAKPKGAVRVEAVSAGPGRSVRDGYEGPVAMRVLYQKADGYEVRQSILSCKLDRTGTVRDAKVTTMPGNALAQAPSAGAYASLSDKPSR